MGGLDAMFWSRLVIAFYRESGKCEPRSLVFARVGKRFGFGQSSASDEFVRASFRG